MKILFPFLSVQDTNTSGYNNFEGWNVILGANPGNRTVPSSSENGEANPEAKEKCGSDFCALGNGEQNPKLHMDGRFDPKGHGCGKPDNEIQTGSISDPSSQQNGETDPAGQQDVHDPSTNLKSLRIFFNLTKHFDSLDIGMAAVVDFNSFNFTRRCR
jgi:hypothetical protein